MYYVNIGGCRVKSEINREIWKIIWKSEERDEV